MYNNINVNKFNLIIILIVFLCNSCYTTTVNLGKFRNSIIKENPDVKLVGFIPDYTSSDNTYLAIEIIFNDNRHLYLTLVNYNNLSDRECAFYLSRIGNYGFDVFYNYVNDNGEISNYTDTVGIKHYSGTKIRREFPITMITDEIGIIFPNNNGNLSNLKIVIENYEKIFNYVDSLPEYNKSYEDVFGMQNNFKKKKSGSFRYDKHTPDNIYYEYYIIMKTEWSDEYFRFGKKPSFTESGSYAYVHWLF